MCYKQVCQHSWGACCLINTLYGQIINTTVTRKTSCLALYVEQMLIYIKPAFLWPVGGVFPDISDWKLIEATKETNVTVKWIYWCSYLYYIVRKIHWWEMVHITAFEVENEPSSIAHVAGLSGSGRGSGRWGGGTVVKRGQASRDSQRAAWYLHSAPQNP